MVSSVTLFHDQYYFICRPSLIYLYNDVILGHLRKTTCEDLLGMMFLVIPFYLFIFLCIKMYLVSNESSFTISCLLKMTDLFVQFGNNSLIVIDILLSRNSFTRGQLTSFIVSFYSPLFAMFFELTIFYRTTIKIKNLRFAFDVVNYKYF